MAKEILQEGHFKRFICEDGWEFTERVRGTGVVAIIARTDAGEILFVEQYRTPVKSFVIEIPAGIVSDLPETQGEELIQAAYRELVEETGYEAGEMELIAEGPASAASLTDIISLFRARKLKKVSEGGGDETEDIIVHAIPETEVTQWLEAMKDKGKLIDPKIYAGLYFLNLEREKIL